MVIVGIVLCALFHLFLEPLCVLFGATEDILPYAMDYGRIISYGILFSSIDSGMAGMIRADGSPKYSMAGLLVGCITNIILDPIFIFVFQSANLHRQRFFLCPGRLCTFFLQQSYCRWH